MSPSPQLRIAVIVGSLRRESFSRKVANALPALAPPPLNFEIVEIGDLPFFNEDLEATPPPEWTRFRERIAAADAVLFVTPEYNRSVPGVLKNAVDVASRPYGQGVWQGKPGAVISTSIGAIGGFGANHHLRQSLVFVNVAALPQPEIYIGNTGSLFDAQGRLVNEGTAALLRTFLAAFADWIEHHAGERGAERAA